MKNPLQRGSRRALREHPPSPAGASLVMAPLPDWLTLQYFSPEFCPELTVHRPPAGPAAPPSPRTEARRAGRRGKS